MDAQAADRARVGLLSLHSADQERAGGIGATAFRAGMQALGYTEPQNVVIEERHANGDKDQLRSLASELVAARVQIIVTVGTDATQAAQQSTSSIPIVMAGVGDAVRSGFVASLAHPGGNITGTAIFSPEATVKQLEVLKEAVPRIRKIGVLRAPAPSGVLNYAALETAATSLGLVLAPAVVADASDLRHHFAEMGASGADAFLVLASPALDDMR